MAQRSGLIQQKDFTSEIQLIKPSMVCCRRRHNYRVSQIIDSFGPNWCLLFIDEPLQIRNGASWVSLQESNLIFIPAFAIIESRFQPGWHSWTSIMDSQTSPLMPQQIMYHQLSKKNKVPNSKEEVFDYFQMLNQQGLILEEQKSASAVAAITKTKLQNNPELSIQEVADQLGYSRFVMSRAFKKTYGLTPIEYRHRSRIFYFLSSISKGNSITDAIKDLGIEDHKTFLIQFKKFTGICPSKYRPVKQNIIKTENNFEIQNY